jgi:AmmeMemoRadiSam system protein B
MSVVLPRLRVDLDVMPSPIPEQPGLVVRDPFRYSDVTLVIPPLLARCLPYFDGAHDEGDVRTLLSRLTGQVAVGEPVRRLVTALRDAGFLDDDRFAEMRAARERAFADAGEREPAHAGSGYPSEVPELVETLDGYYGDGAPAGTSAADGGSGALLGIAAPHASPEGGRVSYAAAYRALPRGETDRIFVLLGTSHYGELDRFGLTRKPFVTPFGTARTERALVDELASRADGAVAMEDYCHAVEHSLEFQVVFLQHIYGPEVRIVPVLCGAFAAGPRAGRPPEHSDRVAAFLDALGNIAARDGDRLCFVLGVDFAHVGRRYGDELPARAHEGAMTAVEQRDRARLERIAAGDAQGFWGLVAERGDDDLKWCGSSPLYSFLRAVPRARGRLLSYEHWNIDDASVVSLGAMRFFDENPRPKSRTKRAK